ncbi:hypothetical protein NQ317_003857 [Molorchus minor]|uniref:Receptor ligand binding region domain-containing protein n=1 Tax=Molorchus minor TaxID=1323400 RepID=A0ABQ9JCS0_9CUCU|nr:hypothetical protein NQ317_003857 [Molorchus minor]
MNTLEYNSIAMYVLRLTVRMPRLGDEQKEPPATINLEVWVRPDYDTYDTYVSDLVKDCGSVAPPGRFGWFIPSDLDFPIQQYYKGRIWNDNMREVHWSIFLDRQMAQIFDLDGPIVKDLINKQSYNRINGSNSPFVCNDPNFCSNSMYTPNRCINQPCAVLLAPSYAATSFLINQTNEMKLFLKILWLGDNLNKFTDEMFNIYTLQQLPKSLLIFYWFPSDIIIDESRYYSVTFKNSELFNFTHTEAVGYKYEMHRLAKLAFSKIEKNAKPLYHAVRSFKFYEKDYIDLMHTYENFPHMSKMEIACQWLKDNPAKWKAWKKVTETVIYIGGIFPVDATSYNGRGIIKAASMATTAVNKNPNILKDYRLQLLALDGKCKTDNVMKSFIDFLVEGYYDQLVGVLGPACSETVEPIAGVSKHYHVLVISYSAEGASFSDRTKYPYFFRTIGENNHYKHVYLKLFQYFGWRRLAALTEDGQKYTEYITLMQDDLEKNSISFIANKKFPKERDTEAMTRYLVDLKSKRARIIIADVVDDIARTVMCEAYKLKMTARQGYVWFLPVWLNTTWYNTDYFNMYKNEKVNCTTKEMIKAITGYFSMAYAYFADDDAIMQENITVKTWRDKYNKLPVAKSDYAGFAYDAVWVYAFGTR